MKFGLIDLPPLRLFHRTRKASIGDFGPASRTVYARHSTYNRLALTGITFAICLCVLPLSSASAQSFGTGKKKVTMQRRPRSKVRFTTTSIGIHVTARDAAQNNVAQSLADLLPTEL